MNIRDAFLLLLLFSSFCALTHDPVAPPLNTAPDPLEGELGDQSFLAADEELREFDNPSHFTHHEREHPALCQVRDLFYTGQLNQTITLGPWTCTKEEKNVTCVKPIQVTSQPAPVQEDSVSWRFYETE